MSSSCFVFSSRRRHTRWPRDWSSDVCSSDLTQERRESAAEQARRVAGGGARDPGVAQHCERGGGGIRGAVRDEGGRLRDRAGAGGLRSVHGGGERAAQAAGLEAEKA